MSKYNTNLASEYYILSLLYRLGLDAYITFGNKKSIDIIVKTKTGVISIDVKGMAGSTSFPVDNFKGGLKNHYLVFVAFRGKISEPSQIPEIYVIPSQNVKKLIYNNPLKTRRVVNLSRLRIDCKNFRDNWKIFN